MASNTVHLLSKGSGLFLEKDRVAMISPYDTSMPQENISVRETSSRARRSWISDTIHMVSKGSGVSLWRNSQAMISSTDTPYEKKGGEKYHRLRRLPPAG